MMSRPSASEVTAYLRELQQEYPAESDEYADISQTIFYIQTEEVKN
jgi:hypothetical protein